MSDFAVKNFAVKNTSWFSTMVNEPPKTHFLSEIYMPATTGASLKFSNPRYRYDNILITLGGTHEMIREQVSRHVRWLNFLGLASFCFAGLGLIAAVVVPGNVTGIIFPIGLGGVWLTSKLSSR